MLPENKTDALAYWINERYMIKMKRDARMDPPWSDNPYMANVRYCNVHREDDKVTRWLADHWRPERHAAWEMLLARMINWIPTLQSIYTEVNPWNIGVLDKVRGEMKSLRDTGEQIFGNAYTISTNGLSMDKVDYVIDRVICPAQVRVYPAWTTLAAAHETLCKLNGVGSFLAGQVIADLKNTKGHALSNASDWWQWATHGPGSLRGLEAYFGRPVTPSGFAAALHQCYTETAPRIAKYVPPMHMQDFQNCLCEFSKFERVKEGGGR